MYRAFPAVWQLLETGPLENLCLSVTLGRSENTLMSCGIFFSQPGVDVTRSTALWCVAGNVQEITRFPTRRARTWWLSGRNQKSALRTFPIRQSAFRTNVPDELTGSCVPTVCTRHFLLFVSHFAYLLSIIDFCRYSSAELHSSGAKTKTYAALSFVSGPYSSFSNHCLSSSLMA